MVFYKLNIVDKDNNIDVKNVGRPLYFDMEQYLDSVEHMICADEVELALKMLENLPGWYRDNQPARALEIKTKVYAQLMSVIEYANDTAEDRPDSVELSLPLAKQIDTLHCTPRGPLMVELITIENSKGIVPHIFEMSPANFWLPHGLLAKGLKFTYDCATIHNAALKKNKEALNQVWLEKKEKKPGQTDFFVCFETIEHLWSPDDIFHAYAKLGYDCDKVLVSTPKYCLHGGLPDWDTRQLGHVRNYTPTDLFKFCTRHWPGKTWRLFESEMMVLFGETLNPDQAQP